jgi:hypothetical protein
VWAGVDKAHFTEKCLGAKSVPFILQSGVRYVGPLTCYSHFTRLNRPSLILWPLVLQKPVIERWVQVRVGPYIMVVIFQDGKLDIAAGFF